MCCINRRAQENNIPLEPVFYDSASGGYAAPQHTRHVTQEWQRWVRVNVYKAKDVKMQAPADVQGRTSNLE